MNDITATVLQRLSVIRREYVQVSVFIGSTIFRSGIALSRNANRIKEGENTLRSDDFRHRPEKTVKSSESNLIRATIIKMETSVFRVTFRLHPLFISIVLKTRNIFSLVFL